MSTPQRKEIVARLRQEGYDAAKAGRHRQTCPHRYCDQVQWNQGYDQYEAEQQVENEGVDSIQVDMLRTQIDSLNEGIREMRAHASELYALRGEDEETARITNAMMAVADRLKAM